MTDGTTVFSGKEKKYDKNRPHYPEALMTFLYAEVGFRADSAIADIGSIKLFADRENKEMTVEETLCFL